MAWKTGFVVHHIVDRLLGQSAHLCRPCGVKQHCYLPPAVQLIHEVRLTSPNPPCPTHVPSSGSAASKAQALLKVIGLQAAGRVGRATKVAA